MSGALGVNQVELSSLHDAELVSLMYESDKVIKLAFVTDVGAHVNIILRGVLRFVANNLLDGNVVLSVSSTKFHNLDSGSVNNIIRNTFQEEFTAVPRERALASNRQWEMWLDQIQKGNLQLFVIEPSYGAEVVAICSDVEFHNVRQ